MSVRPEVAVPSGIAFVFGTACGLVIGWLIATGGQPQPDRAASPPPPGPPAGQAAAASPAQREAELREALRMHEELLTSNPDNARLVRTVAEYHSALGSFERALELYDDAERTAKAGGLAEEELPDIYFGQGLALAEVGRPAEAIAKLEQAAEMRPADVAPRLVQAYVYLRRLMAAPPPGMTRRDVVLKAEELIDEVLVIDPANSEARGLKAQIEGVRRSVQQPTGDGAP